MHFPDRAHWETGSHFEGSALYRLVAFVEEAFDDGRNALGALGRHIDKVGRTHELILVDVLADRAQRLLSSRVENVK